MSARQLSEAGLAALSEALGDLGTVNRWREKVVSLAGSECWWWTGAISGRSHGRFYFAPGRVTISHRFALSTSPEGGSLNRPGSVEVLIVW